MDPLDQKVNYSGPHRAWNIIWDVVEKYIKDPNVSHRDKETVALAKMAVACHWDVLPSAPQKTLTMADLQVGKKYRVDTNDRIRRELRGVVMKVLDKKRTKVIAELMQDLSHYKAGSKWDMHADCFVEEVL